MTARRTARPATGNVSAQAAARIIDGKKIAEDIRGEIAAEVAALKERTGKASECFQHACMHSVLPPVDSHHLD
jgi:hypothetical protein